MSAVRGVASVHGPEAIDAGVSDRTWPRRWRDDAGLLIAVRKDEWTVFHGLPPSEMGRVLQDLARRVRLSHYRKQPRAREAEAQEGQWLQKKHLATAKLLRDQQLPR